ncbi:MAG: polysaccharide biosynthesis/export family protein [Planctomycetales bacterium]|nr:polysaccharide biosynthesis/export family protein [Planctomycetales bacterium]
MVGWFLLLPCWAGCAAFRPLKGVPVQYFPHELRGETRADKETIDLSLLRQTPPDEHLVDAGDVLAVYIEGVLPRREGEIPPVFYPQNNEVPPSLGYPIPVRGDGTLSLPLIKPLHVRAMTLTQVEESVRRAYTVPKQILIPGEDRILISLQRPRVSTVLVIRQEGSISEVGGAGGGITLGAAKRGTGKLVKLPVGENDVLHALAETGGLPGLDAQNQLVIVRRRRNAPAVNFSPTGEFGGRNGAAANAIRQTSATRDGDGWGHTPTQPTRLSSPLVSSRSPQGPDLGDRRLAQADITLPPSAPAPHGVAPPASVVPVSPWDSHPPGLISPKSSGSPGTLPPPAAPEALPVPAIRKPPTSTPTLPPPVPQMPGLQSPPSGPMGPMPSMQPPTRVYQGPLPSSIQGLDWGSQDASRFIDWNGRNRDVIKIPIRMAPGQQPQITEEDIILQDGDILFIESRDTEVFYTGGLLGGGQYDLPRDYDLDVIAAISIASGRQSGGSSGGGFGNRIGGISAMNQDISVSASDVVILRQLPDGNQIPIKTDLGKALRDPKYRVRIQPGDYIILQYKPHEAVAAFVERNLLAGGMFSLAAVSNQGK